MSKSFGIVGAFALFFLPLFASAEPNTCESLAIQKPKDDKNLPANFSDIYENLANFEAAFANQDFSLFRKLLHPSLHKSEEQKKEIFDSTVYEFGLKNAKLSLNNLYHLKFKDPTSVEVKCSNGTIRGLVGSTDQVVAFFSYLGGDEQVRLYTIFIPVLRSQAEAKKITTQNALAHMHAQIWTYEKKAPPLIYEEAKKFAAQGEWMTAWFLSEAALRLMRSNPYFDPIELEAATKLNDELKSKPNGELEAKNATAKLANNFAFLNYTLLYGGRGLEIGAKFRIPSATSAKLQADECKRVLGAISKDLPKVLMTRFGGIQCMPYFPEESLEGGPSQGTHFFTWKNLGL